MGIDLLPKHLPPSPGPPPHPPTPYAPWGLRRGEGPSRSPFSAPSPFYLSILVFPRMNYEDSAQLRAASTTPPLCSCPNGIAQFTLPPLLPFLFLVFSDLLAKGLLSPDTAVG